MTSWRQNKTRTDEIQLKSSQNYNKSIYIAYSWQFSSKNWMLSFENEKGRGGSPSNLIHQTYFIQILELISRKWEEVLQIWFSHPSIGSYHQKLRVAVPFIIWNQNIFKIVPIFHTFITYFWLHYLQTLDSKFIIESPGM